MVGSRSHRLSLVALSLSLAACSTSWSSVAKSPGGPEIVQISLPLSNAFLVKSKPPALIDVGSEGDIDPLEKALSASGTRLTDVGLVIATHGHADHVGNMAAVRKRTRATLLLGEGDVEMARVGHNDELHPMNFTACFLQLVLPQSYPGFTADEVVDAQGIDLHRFGLDGRALEMPGHTGGSVVVMLANHSAFVGDDILGGYLGGAISPHSPGLHYFHADNEENVRNIRTLVDAGVETFYLGHGGPVKRADVIEAFDLEAPVEATAQAVR